MTKTSTIRSLENTLQNVGNIDSNKFFVKVCDFEFVGSSNQKVAVHLLVRFLPTGVPFCCGEPSCYSKAFRSEGEKALAETLRRELDLKQDVTCEIRFTVEYFEGIQFTAL